MPASKKSQLKLPPQNLEAEQAVLGSVLIDKNAIFRVADILVAEDFYTPQHERIYKAILSLYEKRQPIDVLSLTNYLKEHELLKEVGGSAYLADLTNHVSSASHVAHYATIVKEKKVLRDLIMASAEIADSVFANGGEVEDLLDDVEQKILSISQKSMPQNFVSLKDDLTSAYERIAQLHAGGGKLRGVPTGFTGLDDALSGLQKSELIILGARPSVGKTSLALDIARNAGKAGFTVGLFSLEMSRESLQDRIIAAESQVPLWNILTGRIRNDSEFSMIQDALDRLSAIKLFIDDTPSLNVLQMRSMARRLQVEHGLDLLIVDYLQLVRPRTNSDNMVTMITEISRGLKALSRELKVPVLALSQLSRGVEQRDHKIPRLSDLRESGAIEQDADVVMFLYRDERNPNDTASSIDNTVHLRIAKHRNGALKDMDFFFNGELASFKTIEKRYEELPAL
ncbi:MAG TPA: replicative DNA helicase [Candidatus Paceibacterota bacterium]|nr:replicative DNA helicase [Candidatus Paceibacterota bacterium]